MKVEIIPYTALSDLSNKDNLQLIERALLQKGIIGIQHIPGFEKRTQAYINAAREFAQLSPIIKQGYAPNRDAGVTEGYELGAEWFLTQSGEWRKDDKKASYYAHIPDRESNVWPKEMNLRTPYLQLGELIFATGKKLLTAIGIDETVGLPHDSLNGYGRMLHYHQEVELLNNNPDWCGAHFDHGLFTGLIPAYYFCDGKEVAEPEEAGLYIVSTDGVDFEKVDVTDKSVLLFQVGEFAQLLTDDRIKATQHKVKKSCEGVERYSFALFYSPDKSITIGSKSILNKDDRYTAQQSALGSISYGQWEEASYRRYRAT